MFQSLNTTGLPLTSLETFKPKILVIDPEKPKADSNYLNYKYRADYEKVEKLIQVGDDGRTAKKESLTNEFMVIFSLVWSGEPLSKNFSDQRRYLDREFTGKEIEKQDEVFIKTMGDLALFWLDTQLNSYENLEQSLNKLNAADIDIIKLCLAYLRDANHKLANSLIGAYYSSELKNNLDKQKEFYRIVRHTAAYFTLWRASSGTSGLDKSYRNLMEKLVSKKSGGKIRISASSDVIRKELSEILSAKRIRTKSDWIQYARTNLLYGSAPHAVVKFALLAYSNERIADPGRLGLTTKAAADYSKTLTYEAWISKNAKSIEHIAPQDNASGWDKAIYENKKYDLIGNLTLFPVEVNSSASNKGWREKWYYYRILGESNQSARENLKAQADSDGISLKGKTVSELTNSSYMDIIAPLSSLPKDFTWNADFIDLRTEEICETVWHVMDKWLSE
ncbi:hypothetical protein CVO96_05145 [Deinococcus koreensis]|uniref:GmrSD restriction endonucleases C-terminal domain-containing protein n=2 Tax=Deinococcus koreensis TaxID=2054903 RepID=A0A2K3V273_9DEIO|nr:hypothetical protein CVO96_05145 [Deinococcus koreensis]